MATSAMSVATIDATLLLPHHKLAPTYLPLLFSRAPPLRSSARLRLPLTPLIASSDPAEAGLDWAEAAEEEPAAVVEEEGAAASEEFAAEPPEEAKVYIGNLPYDVDIERLAQLFDQAGVIEVAEAADTQVISDYVCYFLHQHTIQQGQPATVKVASNLL